VVLFPASVLWPLARVEEVGEDDPAKSVQPPPSASLGGDLAGAADRTRAVKILFSTARRLSGAQDPLGRVRATHLSRSRAEGGISMDEIRRKYGLKRKPVRKAG